MARIIRTIIIALLAAIMLFPLLYAFSASFFPPEDFTASEARFLPSHISFRGYALALGHRYFGRYMLNSFITALMSATLRTAVSVLAAFAFTHLSFRGKRIILTALLATLFIPPDAMLYENYTAIARMGLLDSYAGIVLPSIFSASAMLLTMGSYAAADRDIYDAARMDGTGDLGYIARMLVPLAAPVSITVFIQAFISSFNSYLWPLLVTVRPRMRTIQIGIAMLGFAEEGEYGAQFAAIIIMTAPFLLLLLAARRLIMKAISGGIS